MNTLAEIDTIKLEMIEEFYDETNKIFNRYFNGNFSIETFKHKINEYFNSWKRCRIDLRNVGGKTNSVKVLNDDSYLTIKYPDWFDNGRGCVVETENKLFDLNIKCNEIGNLNVHLKGVDFRNIEHKRVPIYINYKVLTFRNSLIFNDNKKTWHDKQYIYSNECETNDVLNIKIKFETIFDYFPELIDFQKKLINEFSTNEDIKESLNQFEEYIIKQKIDLVKFINNNQLYENYLNLEKNFNELLNEFNSYKNNTNKIIDSYNLLFNNLFKFNRLEPTTLVKYSRELNNQLLDFIDNVCKKHGLQWWLDFGVLLGAVRHEGNIPWDDDYDISMIREDYDKFFEIIHDEIQLNNLGRHLQVNLNKKGPNNSLLSFIKLEYFDNGRLFGFVDIFPYDYISKEIDDYEHVKQIYYTEHYKFIDELKKGVDRDIALEKYFQLFNVSKTKTDKMILGIEHFNYNQVNYDTVFPLKRMKFEDRLYPCPNNGKEFLRQEYGSDFMNVPKNIYNHGFHDALNRYDDVLEVFEKHINHLKEINSKMNQQ